MRDSNKGLVIISSDYFIVRHRNYTMYNTFRIDSTRICCNQNI